MLIDDTEIRLPSPRELLSDHGFRRRRRLGQCFLVNPGTLGKIADAAALEPGTPAIEIGAGPGYLTAQLRVRTDRVVAIEIDERFRPIHERVFGRLDPPVEFVYADVLKVDWSAMAARFLGEPYRVLGNIPYQITSPLLARLLAVRPAPERMVLLVQREFAQRLTARPGNRTYGALTAKTALVAEIRQVLFVPRQSFQPRPRVDSAAIAIRRLDPPRVAPERADEVFAVIDACFVQRRKKIVNSLLGSKRVGNDREAIVASLEKAGIDPACRAETLAPEDFIRLADAVAGSRQE